GPAVAAAAGPGGPLPTLSGEFEIPCRTGRTSFVLGNGSAIRSFRPFMRIDEHAQHRALASRSGDQPGEALPRVPRRGCAREMAPAERLYLHRAPSGAERRRHVQDVLPELH